MINFLAFGCDQHSTAWTCLRQRHRGGERPDESPHGINVLRKPPTPGQAGPPRPAARCAAAYGSEADKRTWSARAGALDNTPGVMSSACGPIGCLTKETSMSTSTSVAVVLVDDPMRKETIAVAGFLAGYCRSTRWSYAADLRLFSAWCHEAKRVPVQRPACPPRAVRAVDGGDRVDALHRRPAAVRPGQLRRVLRAGAAPRPQRRPQRPSAEGGLRIPNTRSGPQRARRAPRTGRPRLAP